MEISSYRLAIFISLIVIFTILEFVIPRRKRPVKRSDRWSQNIIITILGAIVTKLTLGAVPYGIALYCVNNNFGLLQWLNLTPALVIIFSYILLDLVIYTQHLVFHLYPIFWRLHKVHHSDPDLDVTSGFRFHPVEIFLSLIVKSVTVLIIGASPEGVIIFEIILSSGALFNHSNINIPSKLENILRMLLVTPDVHIIHHSTIKNETNSNFGFTIVLWDKLFGTFKSQPKLGHDQLNIGLSEYNNLDDLKIKNLLLMPLDTKSQEYSKR